MAVNLEYANEKCWSAIESLVLSNDHLRERCADAWKNHLSLIDANILPGPQKLMLIDLRQQVEKYASYDDRLGINFHNRNVITMKKLASSIINFAHSVSADVWRVSP